MIRTVRQSFAAGEMAPELHMRSDLNAYQKGAALLRNIIVRRTGSAMKRPGSDALDVGAGFGSGKTVRIFPFYYDNDLSLALLVTNTLVRVFEVSPGFKFDRDFAWESEWTDDQVAAMRVKQVGDTLFCSAPGKLPVRMVRQASTKAWTVATEQIDTAPSYTVSAATMTAAVVGQGPSPYKVVRYALWARNASGQLSKLWANKEVTVSAAWTVGESVRFSIAGGNIPTAAIGHDWLLCKFYGGEYGEIASHAITMADIVGGTQVMFEDINIIPGSQIAAQTNIRAGADSAGYAMIDFYQQRQVLSGNTGSPWSLWFSRLADLYIWTTNRPADDMDPFRATIPAMRASDIRHTISSRRLLIFTTDGIYAVHSGSEGFSARSCKIEKVHPTGAGRAVPIDTGSAVIFLADDDRTLLEMRYSFADDAHVAVDRSVLARHLSRAARVVAVAWQAWPDGVLWCLLDDGQLLSFTYLPEHEVFAWARHALPVEEPFYLADIIATGAVLPTLADSSTYLYEATSAAIILAQGTGGEYALLRMRRPGAASDGCVDLVRSVEAPAPDEEEEEDGVRTLPAPVGAVWRVDGGAWAEVEEAGGVEVQGPCLAEWGWPVAAELETLRPEAPERALQALRRRVVSCTIRTLESGSFRVSDASAGGLDTEVSGDGADGAAHDVKLPLIGGWDWDGRIRIASPGVDKLEVLGVVTDLETEGGGR